MTKVVLERLISHMPTGEPDRVMTKVINVFSIERLDETVKDETGKEKIRSNWTFYTHHEVKLRDIVDGYLITSVKKYMSPDGALYYCVGTKLYDVDEYKL